MKGSPCWLGQVEFVMTMRHQYGNQMGSMSEVWIPGNDGTRNFSVSLYNTHKVMEMTSHPGIDCRGRRLSSEALQHLEVEEKRGGSSCQGASEGAAREGMETKQRFHRRLTTENTSITHLKRKHFLEISITEFKSLIYISKQI